MRWLILSFGILLPNPGVADVNAVHRAAQLAFDRMPGLQIVADIEEQCGADKTVDARVAYCTTSNRILIARRGLTEPATMYLVAHALGHAVQVQHGVADVALTTIRARPKEEAALRAMVEGQVDCIAGFILQRAGNVGLDIMQVFAADPLSERHWGRDPLRVGPKATVPVGHRAAWVARGGVGEVAACAVGEFGSDLLVQALK